MGEHKITREKINAQHWNNEIKKARSTFAHIYTRMISRHTRTTVQKTNWRLLPSSQIVSNCKLLAESTEL